MPSKRSIAECLIQCGISEAQVFDDVDTVEDEFKLIKKSYFKQILTHHPDKGGDAEIFKKIQTSFEILRDLLHNQAVSNSFAEYLNSKRDVEADRFDDIYQSYKGGDVPSYEHYEEAAEEEMPLYRVERAKSGRSQCVKCKASMGSTTKKPKTARNTRGNSKSKQALQETALLVTKTSSSKSTPTVESKSIPKGNLRFGRLLSQSGSYTNWHKVKCWRVPSKIWSGLTIPDNMDVVLQDLLRMEDVLLSGMVDLTDDEQKEVLEHIMDRNNWAKKLNTTTKETVGETSNGVPNDSYSIKKRVAADNVPSSSSSSSKVPSAPSSTGSVDEKENKRPKTKQDEEHAPNVSSAAGTAAASSLSTSIVTTKTKQSSSSTAMDKKKQRFIIPKPGQNGAVPSTKLQGKRFVMTGIFPEVGGGSGLNLGKERTKKMILSFGGRVTSAVSGKTNYLIVGKSPGASKVGQAQRRGVVQMDIRAAQQLLMGEIEFANLDVAPPPMIESFSAGYQGRFSRIGY